MVKRKTTKKTKQKVKVPSGPKLTLKKYQKLIKQFEIDKYREKLLKEVEEKKSRQDLKSSISKSEREYMKEEARLEKLRQKEKGLGREFSDISGELKQRIQIGGTPKGLIKSKLGELKRIKKQEDILAKKQKYGFEDLSLLYSKKEDLSKGLKPEIIKSEEELLQEQRQKAIAIRLKGGLERREAEVARKQADWEAKSRFQKTIAGVSPEVRKLDTKVGAVVRKAIHLVTPKGSIKSLTRPTGKKAGGGRGRPSGTFKKRFVPGVGIVKVPTHIYKRMLAEAKAKRRLAEAQRQAKFQQQSEAEQIAMQQDPRFQPSQEDAWADSEDVQHESDVQQTRQGILQQQQLQRMQQQVQQEQQPGIVNRAGQMFGNARISLMGTDREMQRQLGAEGQQPFDPLHRPQVEPIHRPQLNPDRPKQLNPRVSVTGGKSPMFSRPGPSILSQGNEFNKPSEATIGLWEIFLNYVRKLYIT